MRGFISKIWFPAAVICASAVQMASSGNEFDSNGASDFTIIEIPARDTVIYPASGYKKGWDEDEFEDVFEIADSLLGGDSLEVDEYIIESPRPAALDSIVAPDSLSQLDTFLFKYYAAVKDSLCHRYIRDSLAAIPDSAAFLRLDSLYAADSTWKAKEAFLAWYSSLSKEERRNYDKEQEYLAKKAYLDSLADIKAEKKAYKDSVIKDTPRIWDSYWFKDSLRYQRIISWTADQQFHELSSRIIDSTYNDRYHFMPFRRNDVNASWLGVSGSPVKYYDAFKHKSIEKVSFYQALEPWSYSPSTLPMYNSKTPHTELSYYGTLVSGSEKESDNIHLLTTQNILPELNVTLAYDRYGGKGMLLEEETANKTFYASANYVGKKYMAHAGYISNKVTREENGGIKENTWIRDTTLDAKEIEVMLSDASSKVQKKTVFVDQQLRIPFYFIQKLLEGKDTTQVQEEELPEIPLSEDDQEAESEQEEIASDEEAGDNVTTAFIGHSSEYSVYTRTYTDAISDADGKNFYNGTFNYNPTSSNDSLRVMKLDNKAFIRLQPWSDDAIVSKLNVGIGERLMRYYTFDKSYLHESKNAPWNATYLYAGAEGKFKEYIDWNAHGNYVLLGAEAGDFDIDAKAALNIYPFRKDRKGPVRFEADFDMSLTEPEYYQQHLYTNHFSWDNDFGKIYEMNVQALVSIPRWDLSARIGYKMLSNNIYYDAKGIVQQNGTPMSILSATVRKNLQLANLVHLDHNVLFQLSSNEEVVPLPMLAVNGKYYIQFSLFKEVLKIQAGLDVWYNTMWYAPSWNPALGVFHNQTEEKYGNCPYADAFVNMQWKRACIFVKAENVGMGWPMQKADYFSANHYINTQRAIKFGVFWPFFTQPTKMDRIPKPSESPYAD